MGSVVLEQLLRFAPDVARIYMLIRGKRGCSGEQRLDNLLQRDLFCKLRNGDEFPEEVTPQCCSLCPVMQSKLAATKASCCPHSAPCQALLYTF